MQLLDLPDQKQLDTLPANLQTSLEDIVNRLQIESNFCIRHPDYQPLELPTEVVERFRQLPQDLQDKYLSQQLRGFLYGIYYNGSLKTALAPDTDGNELALNQNLENNTFLGVDLGFYERLHQSNRGKGYFDPGWQVRQQDSDRTLAVTKGSLTLYIDVEQHLPSEQREAKVGDVVAIHLPKNRVQNGFYMAVGNVGLSQHRNADQIGTTVRIYFHLTAEGAVAVMESLTEQLNQLAIPFSFKALYNPSNYGRYDSAVLYFDSSHYKVVKPILQSLYQQHQIYFQSEVPLFTKLLAPGLALAEEPDQKFSDQESFGMNRCQIIANGLLAARKQGDDTPASRMKAIWQQFSLLGINLEYSYLNANSEDIYTSLEL